jgi:hypothetical protein
MEVKVITVAQAELGKAMVEAFPPPQLDESKVPLYFSFYRPEGTNVTPKDMKFTALTEERRKEVLQDNFKRYKLGGW